MAVIIILSFIAVFLLVTAIFLVMAEKRESHSSVLKRRLWRLKKPGKDGAPGELQSELVRDAAEFHKSFSRIPLLRSADKLIDQAGLRITLSKFLFLVLIIATAAFVSGMFISRNIVLAAGISLTAAAVPFLCLQHLKLKRREKFTEQLPDVLSMISRSLRAGHSLAAAVELVSQEMPAPAKDLFKVAFEQQKLGLRAAEAIINMTDRMDSLDLRFFATVVTINSEVGGNLGEILDNLANIIRERYKVKRQVRVYTAQGRMSGYVLAALPVIAFFIFNAMMPGYEDVLIKESKGQLLLGAAILAQTIGYIVIKKIISIRI